MVSKPMKVMLPAGDPERLMRAEPIKNGVPIDPETWREIVAAARGINVLIETPRSNPG
jgi:LDH2 family malate/lactate/ureidoglycolate dehydrogenase